MHRCWALTKCIKTVESGFQSLEPGFHSLEPGFQSLEPKNASIFSCSGSNVLILKYWCSEPSLTFFVKTYRDWFSKSRAQPREHFLVVGLYTFATETLKPSRRGEPVSAAWWLGSRLWKPGSRLWGRGSQLLRSGSNQKGCYGRRRVVRRPGSVVGL